MQMTDLKIDFNFIRRNKKLKNKWWQLNIKKLVLIALKNQTEIRRRNGKLGEFRIFQPSITMSVSIVSDKIIKILNKKYRNKNKSTDVLSFSQKEFNSFLNLENEQNLGDIVISLDKVLKQAHEYNHSIEREASFLFIHGFLHLFGYDHKTINDEKRMYALQEEILMEAGFPRNISSPKHIAYISLGSNQGDKRGIILQALNNLTKNNDIKINKISSLYETKAIGLNEIESENFFNIVCSLQTNLNPAELFRACQKIESNLGRASFEKGLLKSRRIDIDLILYDDIKLDSSELKIPHPKYLERDFVLIPLLEILDLKSKNKILSKPNTYNMKSLLRKIAFEYEA